MKLFLHYLPQEMQGNAVNSESCAVTWYIMQKHRCLYGDHKRVNNETAPLSHTPKLFLIYLWLMYKYAYIHFSLSLSLSLSHTHIYTATILHHSILGSLPLLPLLPTIYCRNGNKRQWKQQNRNKAGAERKTWRNTLKCTTEIQWYLG